MNIYNFDVIIIGGGPAGMIAAGRAAEQEGAKVAIIEKNNILGRKLLITGKGRCNFTHYEFDRVKFAEKFGKKGRFLYSALERFGIPETLDFFQSRGLSWQVERGNRIFPDHGDANSILKILLEYLKKGQVNEFVNSQVVDVENIIHKDNFKVTLSSGDIFLAKKLILCTGGKSYPQTGSTGDGYNWAKKFGHTIVPLAPALNPVRTSEKWVTELQGLTLKNVSLQLYKNGKKQEERFGEMLFTHFGISGPIVMDMSKYIDIHLKKGNVKLWLDLKPALDFKKLDKRILRDFQEFKGRILKNCLKKLLPNSLIAVICHLAGIEEDRKIDYISKAERNNLVHTIKELELTPTELLGYKWAMITSGGLDLREINPDTMESKKIKNLYFAGEILDLDGPSGGYNLQECWSTGFLAGENSVKGD